MNNIKRYILTSSEKSGTEFKNKSTHFITPIDEFPFQGGDVECGLEEIILPPAYLSFQFRLYAFHIIASEIVAYSKINTVTHIRSKPENVVEADGKQYCINCESRPRGSPLELIKFMQSNGCKFKTKFYIPHNQEALVESIENLFTLFPTNKEIHYSERKSRGTLIHINEKRWIFESLGKTSLNVNEGFHLCIAPDEEHDETRKCMKILHMVRRRIYNDQLEYGLNLNHYNCYLSSIDIVLDILEYSKVGNNYVQLLKNVPRYNPYAIESYRPNKIEWIKVKKLPVESIETLLTNQNGIKVAVFRNSIIIIAFRKV